MWELENGPIPAGMDVCHHCDNRLCLNTKHLFLGTRLDNMRDAVRKGRQARGEGNGKSVLTVEAVRDIRANARAASYPGGRDGSIGEYAAKYGVSHSLVAMILKRKRWGHID
jgi:hypothetical protein